MEDFEGNPVDRESWWRMTTSMVLQAARHGIFNLIKEQAKNMELYNFALDLVDGSDFRKLEGTSYHAEKAKKANPNQKEIYIGRKRA